MVHHLRALLLSISFIVLFSPREAACYEFTTDFTSGSYWAELPVNFSVQGNEAYDAGQLHAAVSEAAANWHDFVGESIWTILAPGSSNRNIVRWSSDFAGETGREPEYTLAVAVRYTQGVHWIRSEIILNPEADIDWNFANLVVVLTHELGHTMGLGHSRHQDSIMHPYLGNEKLGQDDQRGMIAALNLHSERMRTGPSLAALGAGGQSSDSGRKSGAGCGLVHDVSNNTPGGPQGPQGAASFLFLALSLLLLPLLRQKRAGTFQQNLPLH